MFIEKIEKIKRGFPNYFTYSDWLKAVVYSLLFLQWIIAQVMIEAYFITENFQGTLKTDFSVVKL